MEERPLSSSDHAAVRTQVDAQLAAAGMTVAARRRWWTAHNGWVDGVPARLLHEGRFDEVWRALHGLLRSDG